MLQPEPTNARFVGGPLDGETHLLAHSLPFVQVPGPGESFFARLWAERPDCPDHLLYEVDGADTDGETLLYRSVADGGGSGTGASVSASPGARPAGAPDPSADDA